MICEAVLTCIKYMHNFNPDKSKYAFAYISKICFNSFRSYIKKQKKHSEIKDKCYNNSWRLNDEEHYTTKTINYELLV